MSTFKLNLPLMEELEPLQQTLRKIDRRVPDALRATFRLGYRALPPARGRRRRRLLRQLRAARRSRARRRRNHYTIHIFIIAARPRPGRL